MFFDFKHFFQHIYRSVFRTEGTHQRLTWKRIRVLIVFYLLFPVVEVITWLGFTLDDIFYPEYKELPVRKPVFVIGNYRSGTTFLHRLMAMDTGSFTAMAGWEIFAAPSITQRKVMAWLVKLDRVLGSNTQKIFDSFWQKNVQDNVDFHQLGVNEPEEDESLLAHIWSGIIPWNMFPVMDDGIPQYAAFDTALSEKEKKRVMKFYKRCVQRHMYVHGDAKHYLSKSPSFSGKVDSLYKTFPDAKIIYLVRNPMQMVPSQVNMWSFKWNVTLEPMEEYPYTDELLEMIKYWYQHPLEVLSDLPEEKYKIVLFDDLTANPEAVVRDIYAHFNLELTPAYGRRLHRVSQRSLRRSRKVNKQRHQLSQMGISNRRMIKEFSGVFRRFGYMLPRRKKISKQQRKLNRVQVRTQRRDQRAMVKKNRAMRRKKRYTRAQDVI